MVIPDIEKIFDLKFKNKPLLIGGLAMEYYGLRKAGDDIDFILTERDHQKLENNLRGRGLIYLQGENKTGFKHVPELVDLYGDRGILFHEFEIWNCILRFGYEFLSQEAVENESCKIISMQRLLFLKSLCIDQEKYLHDVKLIAKKIISDQYKAQDKH